MSIRLTEIKLNEIKMQQQRIAMTNGNGNRCLAIPRCKKERIYGSVVEIKGNTVYLELNESLDRFTEKTQIQPCDEEYFIRFMSDRTTITLQHRALEYLNDQDIASFFFPMAADDISIRLNQTHPSTYINQT